MVRLPLTFIVLLFMLNVPPVTTTSVGASVLPTLLVHVPLVLTSMLPPIVVLVPSTVTAAEVDTLLPPFVAVFPVNVILGEVPFNNKLAPATKMPPPLFAAELFVNRVLATVVPRDSTMMPPPLAVPSAWLFEKVEVPKVADPVPMPPGEPNAAITRSAPPPPAVRDEAVLRLKVVPVTVRMPVDAVCAGADGVNIRPPPLPA